MALDTPTLTWEQYQQLPPDQRRRPLTAAEYAALTRQQRVAAGLDDDEEGAPADFNGPVFSNPQHIQPQLDTDPTMPVTRLPNGVSFQRQNFSGSPQMDVSNPATADVMPTMGREIAAKTDGAPVVDYDALAQKHGATPAVDYEALAAKHGASNADNSKKDEPGMLDREIPLDSTLHATESGLQSIGRGLRDAAKGSYQTIIKPPETPTEEKIGLLGPVALPLYRMLRGAGHTASDATQIVGAVHDINASADPTGTYLKAAQETAGQGAGQALLALGTEGAARVLPKIPEALETPAGQGVAAGVKAAAKKLPAAAVKRIPYVGPVATDVAEAARSAYKAAQAEDAGVMHSEPSATPEQLNPALVSPARTLPGQVGREVVRPPAAPVKLGPQRQLALPPAEVIADDVEGVPSQQTSTAGEVHDVESPEPSATPTARAAAPSATSAEAAAPPAAAKPATAKAPLSDLQNQIEKALGGKPLARGIPLKNQTPLPEGFTPTPDSSLLKGYKYDPAAQEFEAVLKNGERYAHGQVTPDQFERFEAADSQGSAWTKEIKQGPGTVLVRKNGVPVVKPRTVVFDPETGAPEFSDVLEAKPKPAAAAPKAAAPKPAAKPAPVAAADEDDLTAQMQQSLGHAEKGAVFTTASPKDLLTRWGVDPESFAEGRSQTRGMNADESAAAIKKLTAAYKKGQPVEPLLETRDADNNIIEVDGRGRALAAHRAGVDRIPIIVRRMPATK
jgi:hypothetical protein